MGRIGSDGPAARVSGEIRGRVREVGSVTLYRCSRGHVQFPDPSPIPGQAPACGQCGIATFEQVEFVPAHLLSDAREQAIREVIEKLRSPEADDAVFEAQHAPGYMLLGDENYTDEKHALAAFVERELLSSSSCPSESDHGSGG